MILQGKKQATIILPDPSFWNMIGREERIEIQNIYKVFCPTILGAELSEGSDSLFNDNFEVVTVHPWHTLAKIELMGGSVENPENFAIETIGNIRQQTLELPDLIAAFDNSDRYASGINPILTDRQHNPLVGFANSDYERLEWSQFIERVQNVTRGTMFYEIARLIDPSETNLVIRSNFRTAFENLLSRYRTSHPVDNFEKAFDFALFMLEGRFWDVCNGVLIPMLESVTLDIEFNRTYWDESRNEANNDASNLFPYTWYVMQIYIARYIYQIENRYNKTIEATDIEYLYYLYFSNVLFVSSDKQHERYITESGLFSPRNYGSFIYVPRKEHNPDEYDRCMRYIKSKTQF